MRRRAAATRAWEWSRWSGSPTRSTPPEVVRWASRAGAASAASFSGPGHRDRPGGERRMGEGERSGADRNNAYPSPRTHIHRPERISVTPNAYLSSRAQRGICFIAGDGSPLAALGLPGTPKHDPVPDAQHPLLGTTPNTATP